MDGIIIINKEKEYTSHDIVAVAKKILQEKVGHTGTLDPNATGVLPLLIGKGTKLSKYLINHDKVYEATIKLGIKTDTADIWGNIIEKDENKIEKIEDESINQILKTMIGKTTQIPPMYSAIKINGRKLYEYARKNEKIEVEPREIEIYSIDLEDIDKKQNEIKIKISCSKGTYIRTICEEIAKSLNTVGCMKALNRLQVGDFKIENSITLDELKKYKEANEISKYLITFEDILLERPKIILDNHQLELFLNGVKLFKEMDMNIYKVYDKNNIFIGTGIIEDGQLKRDIII